MKIKLPYTTTNNLKEYVIKRMGQEMINTGRRITKKEIVKEIADYCSVTPDNIERIIKNYSQPSLGVAIKIAKYFGVSVEDIFQLKEGE